MDSYDHILARLSRFDEDLNRSRLGVQSTKRKKHIDPKKLIKPA